MVEKRAVVGRVAGFYEERKRRREDDEEENEEDKLVIGEEQNGVYKVEKVVEMRKKKVSQDSQIWLANLSLGNMILSSGKDGVFNIVQRVQEDVG